MIEVINKRQINVQDLTLEEPSREPFIDITRLVTDSDMAAILEAYKHESNFGHWTRTKTDSMNDQLQYALALKLFNKQAFQKISEELWKNTAGLLENYKTDEDPDNFIRLSKKLKLIFGRKVDPIVTGWPEAMDTVIDNVQRRLDFINKTNLLFFRTGIQRADLNSLAEGKVLLPDNPNQEKISSEYQKFIDFYRKRGMTWQEILDFSLLFPKHRKEIQWQQSPEDVTCHINSIRAMKGFESTLAHIITSVRIACCYDFIIGKNGVEISEKQIATKALPQTRSF